MKRTVIFILLIFSFGVLFRKIRKRNVGARPNQKNVKTKRIGSFDQTGGNGDCLRRKCHRRKTGNHGRKRRRDYQSCLVTIAPGNSQSKPERHHFSIYWDGNSFPSVESPIGYLFGNGWNGNL